MRTAFHAGSAIWLLLAMGSCEIAQESVSARADDVEDLRLTANDISGWSERQDGSFGGYVVQVGNELCGLPIDGDCIPYTNKGVVKTIIQYMAKPATPIPLQINIYAMDFGTPEKAREMFDEMRTNAHAPIGGFTDTVAIAEDLPSEMGCVFYAHFRQFYIQGRLRNYTPASLSLGDAALFARMYSKKITGL